MAGPRTWGPIEPPQGREHEAIGAKSGEPTLSTPMSHEGAPRHTVHYDATDSRHNYETGQRPWESVDVHSGHTSDSDFGTLTGRFEDGPGVWRQT